MLIYRKVETGPISKEGSNILAVSCICLTQLLLCNYYVIMFDTNSRDAFVWKNKQTDMKEENQDGGIGGHTAPPRTTRTDRKSNGKEVRHQGNKR